MTEDGVTSVPDQVRLALSHPRPLAEGDARTYAEVVRALDELMRDLDESTSVDDFQQIESLRALFDGAVHLVESALDLLVERGVATARVEALGALSDRLGAT